MRYLILLTCLLCGLSSHSQVLIGSVPAATPSASAMLELDANNKGMLIPRMPSADRLAIASPVQGLWVFQNNDNSGYFFYTGTDWVRVSNDRTVPGKVIYNQVTSIVTVPAAYASGANGYSASYAGNGEFDVAFNTIFNDPPVVMLTSQSIPPPASIGSAQDYCDVGFAALCTTNFNADYIDRVRIQSHNGIVLVGASGFDNNNTGCNGNPNNYTNYFDGLPGATPVIEATLYGQTAYPGAFYNISMASGPEWTDPLFAFIDWNQNGEFEDSENILEEYFGTAANDDLITEPALEVPTCAPSGVTAMRTIAQFSQGLPETCSGDFLATWGEVEDYKINVVGNTPPGACQAAGPRSMLCNPSDITTSGFKVTCATASGGLREGTSFDFYTTEY